MALKTTEFLLKDEEATAALGVALADVVLATAAQLREYGLTIGLTGDLGAGKTALVRAVLRRAGVGGTVKSPSFSLLEPYEVSRLHFYHFDFYRFKAPEEFLGKGLWRIFRLRRACAWSSGPSGPAVTAANGPANRPAGPGVVATAGPDARRCSANWAPGRRARIAANTEFGVQCLKLFGGTMVGNPRRRLIQGALGAAGSMVLWMTPHIARGAALLAVRVWPAPEYTRVTIEHDVAAQVPPFLAARRQAAAHGGRYRGHRSDAAVFRAAQESQRR